MRDVFVLEASDDMNDGVHFADMREELISESLAVACALDEPCNIDEFDDGGGDFFAVIKSCELVQPFIGDGDHAHVGLDGAEWVVCGIRTCVRDGIEEGGFSHIGKTYDAEFHKGSFLSDLLF